MILFSIHTSRKSSHTGVYSKIFDKHHIYRTASHTVNSFGWILGRSYLVLGEEEDEHFSFSDTDYSYASFST